IVCQEHINILVRDRQLKKRIAKNSFYKETDENHVSYKFPKSIFIKSLKKTFLFIAVKNNAIQSNEILKQLNQFAENALHADRQKAKTAQAFCANWKKKGDYFYISAVMLTQET
ncbi:MAG: hypothetical protein KDC13_07445, partial [Bacteroidetes bacterium]|nr:hypothetical protein [Bacteroidota bacterium]